MQWRANLWPVMAKRLPSFFKAFNLIREKIMTEKDEIVLTFQEYDNILIVNFV